MKIWGYIFVVLNIGAAGAFIYFATQVWKARTEWQYALLKAELANIGLPLEPREHPETDLDPGIVNFGFKYRVGEGEFTQPVISTAQLNKLIPAGGTILGLKGGQPVANQTDEVKRVEKVVFGNLEKIDKPAEKRLRLLLVLTSLAKGMDREGTFALLYDYPRGLATLKELNDADVAKKQTFEWQIRRGLKERLFARSRQELAYLGKTGQQVSALLALNAVEEANLAYGPNVSPEEKERRLTIWRNAIVAWAMGQTAYATPTAPPPLVPPAEDAEKTLDQKETERLRLVMIALEPLMKAEKPDAAAIDEAKKKLSALLEGDDAIQRESAKIMIPFIADVGTNLLDTEDKVGQVKAQLLKLVLDGATTEAETKSLTVVADLIVPPKAEAGADEIQRADAAIDTAATEQLRAYFEQAIAKPSTELPEDVPQARAKLASLKPIRDPAEKQRAIAHLLYHLDAYTNTPPTLGPATWYNLFIAGDPKASTTPEAFRFLDADEELMKSRPAWHQRVAAVVGLQNYVAAAEAQASEYTKMVDRIRTRIAQEQSIFEAEYQSVVEEAIRGARLMTVRTKEVEDKKMNLDYAEKRLAIEKAELDIQLNLLKDATNTSNTAQTELGKKVDELFQITKKLAEAQDSLVSLEIRLREIEFRTLEPKKK